MNWGTVCDDNFDAVDARVVCQSMFGMHAGGELVPSTEVIEEESWEEGGFL